MFKRIFKLFTLQIKEKFHGLSLKNTTGMILTIVLRIALIVGLTFGIGFILPTLRLYYPPFKPPFLGVLVILIFIIILLTSISTCRRVFFAKTDNEFLLSLPVSTTEVYASKILIVFLQQILSSFTLMLPILLAFHKGMISIYFIPQNSFFVYFLICFVVTILLTLLAIGLSLLILIPLQYLKRLSSRYLVISIITMLLTFALLFWVFSLVVGLISDNITIMGNLYVIMSRLSSFVDDFTSQIGFAVYLGHMFVSSAQRWILLLITGITVFVLVVALIAARFVYFRLGESMESVKMTSKKFRQNKVVKSNVLNIAIKDLTTVARTPGGLFLNFAMFIIFPFFIYFISKFSDALEISSKGVKYLLGATIMIFLIFTMTGAQYISTSISSEGKNFYLTKNAPVSFRKQAISKLLVYNAVCMLSILVSTIIFSFISKHVWWEGTLIFVIVALLNFSHSLYTFEIELKKPSINWYDEEAVKSSTNTVKSIIFGLIIGVLFGLQAMRSFDIFSPLLAWGLLLVIAVGYTLFRFFQLRHRLNYFYIRIEP